MVPLGLPSARPMAQALRLPFEYYIRFIAIATEFMKVKNISDILIHLARLLIHFFVYIYVIIQLKRNN